MTKLLLSFLALSMGISQTIMGQEIDSTALKQLEFIKKVTYGMGNDLFKTRELSYKIKEDYMAPWDKLSISNMENLATGLDTIISNGAIAVEKGHFEEINVVFSSKVEGIENLDDIFTIELVDYTLFDANKNPIRLKESARTNFGAISNSGIKNGQQFSYNYRTIKSAFEIESKKDTLGISGTVKLQASFPSGYDKVVITPKDIGKQFTIGLKKYEVLKVYDNIIILKPDSKNENLDRDFEIVNLNAKGDEIGQIAYFDLLKMNEGKDKPIEMIGVGTQTISEKIYKIFSENPTISKEEFDSIIDPIARKIFSAEDIRAERERQFGETYIAITNAGPVENCYLYLEKRELKRAFEKEF
ncbi:hypothetical protein H0I25_02055 [Cellulophaga sp. HaHa_2_95]|uniref:hypothetical protein n=1 Tax=Cellulophaga sp. HaHa_2_95 TaxID=2745558 RepID=UPI001C4FDAA2|nr:hypothetical protein [Cellulophaga sp. HaHa_2_95]QXP56600.1 hypothetical protein H0I25_02055 [Cellulophaga sp. HaHa_2_95]